MAGNNIVHCMDIAKAPHQMLFFLGPAGIGKTTAARHAVRHLVALGGSLRGEGYQVLAVALDMGNGSRLLAEESLSGSFLAQRFCLMLFFGETFGDLDVSQEMLDLHFTILDVLEVANELFPQSRDAPPRVIAFLLDDAQLHARNASGRPIHDDRWVLSLVSDGMADGDRSAGQFGFALVPIVAGTNLSILCCSVDDCWFVGTLFGPNLQIPNVGKSIICSVPALSFSAVVALLQNLLKPRLSDKRWQPLLSMARALGGRPRLVHYLAAHVNSEYRKGIQSEDAEEVWRSLCWSTRMTESVRLFRSYFANIIYSH